MTRHPPPASLLCGALEIRSFTQQSELTAGRTPASFAVTFGKRIATDGGRAQKEV